MIKESEDTMLERIVTGELDEGLAAKKEARKRKLVLTSAADIEMKPIHWLWEKRMAIGELTLLAGAPGLGKSTIAEAELVAWITTGTMKGRYLGKPSNVLIAASEDSWEHTLVPRLVAAGADLSRVFRCEVFIQEDVHGSLDFPLDIKALRDQIKENDIKLIILDPITSRLSSNLDTHKDADVRKALEPIVAMIKDKDLECALLGIIHTNKSSNTDPLKAIMASVAFGAVARGVLFVIKDPMDEKLANIGLVKSNISAVHDLPTYKFRIISKRVGGTDLDPITAGVIEWLGDSDRTIGETLENNVSEGGAPAVQEAADWLSDFLNSKGGAFPSKEIKKEAGKDGISASALDRARKRLQIEAVSEGFPRRSTWQVPGYKKPSGMEDPSADGF